MSAKDKFHDVVKTALQNDGWVITEDPLRVPIDRITNMYIDLAAEKLIVADKEGDKIAVEVKSFLGASNLSEFHTALGQFINYRYALEDFEAKRILYLAVPVKTYEDFFTMPFVQSVIQRSNVNLLVFNPEKQEIVQWKN
ncbi:XisH family protein [Rivularia sp. UHCC 0363]|uniref:XisH family protein n=1 Tax=Rivularia sp. UHCC 0363 TaxID=3110244 RepID=UPI002B22090B|nr:XisH family protein [Rivularia sp. UHCC 0363]MEA5595324.1 XisH family protein [Rivularia sp. UHCC 0363]